jgi:hypothetical protein
MKIRLENYYTASLSDILEYYGNCEKRYLSHHTEHSSVPNSTEIMSIYVKCIGKMICQRVKEGEYIISENDLETIWGNISSQL